MLLTRALTAPMLAATVAASALVASPALAQRLTVSDPAGDATARGLDVTSATVRNRDYRIVTKVAFVRARPGDLIVSIDRRKGRGLRMVSQYRPNARTRNYLVEGAFTDKVPANTVRRVACRGFRVRWNAEEDTARMVLPARCFHRGNYGAIRFALLTENARGAGDADFAPDAANASPWVARG